MSAQPKPDSWFHSSEFDTECRRRRAQQRAWFCGKVREETADPEEVSSEERRRTRARARYFSRETDAKSRCSDPRQALPQGADLQAFVDTFGAAPERFAQAIEMKRRGLHCKAKRLVLCGRIGRRLDCTICEHHKFFQPYACRCRYCDDCGPAWFRQKFLDMVVALEPVVERLLHEGQERGREMIVAKLDFTVPKTGAMPTPEFVRKFHADLRRFFRALERRFSISRKEYGHAGNDEFGGGNTNLHRHCAYVGPKLPQSKLRKELSALWSEIRGERSFVSIKRARSFRAALAHGLKYPAKFLNASTPERLAELEATFHCTRRFSAGGAFYNVTPIREPGEDSPIGECPLCGARLCEVLEPWVPRSILETEGRRSVELARREAGRARFFRGPARRDTQSEKPDGASCGGGNERVRLARRERGGERIFLGSSAIGSGCRAEIHSSRRGVAASYYI